LVHRDSGEREVVGTQGQRGREAVGTQEQCGHRGSGQREEAEEAKQLVDRGIWDRGS
jgi:hypothetical protein